MTVPNGQHRDYGYDDQDRLLQIANIHPGTGNLATYSYGHDHDWTTDTDTMLGQRTSLTATVPSQGMSGALSKRYYDPLYQLRRADYPNVAPFNGEVHQWTHDNIGNRLTNTVNSSTQTYTYQKIGINPLNWQRLLSDGENAYTYDPNGSTGTRSGPSGNFSFGWNQEGWMSSILGPITVGYNYDYQGRRTLKNLGGPNPTYLYDGLNLIKEGGPTPADYLFGPAIDEPLAMSRGGSISYYNADALGSVSLLNDAGGTVQNSYLYDAWGVTRAQTEAVANSFTYTAREKGEAGSLFYRARFLSPTTGRFLSEDAHFFYNGLTPYGYVDNRLTKWRDPSGLQMGVPPGTPYPRGGRFDGYALCMDQVNEIYRQMNAACIKDYDDCVFRCKFICETKQPFMPFVPRVEVFCLIGCSINYGFCETWARVTYSAGRAACNTLLPTRRPLG